ncbi:MAG: DNA polymerase III subunit gamma/tau, partial [Firmicutes bacterium]|nr:DNA polymerase III subunit gamma/tau [Bacillota bacterium]
MYLALYRKYRPRDFGSVIGQPHITGILTNQIKNGSVSHSYLFSGTRGTGKTSVAKIFASAINCLAPEDGSPCGECEICRVEFNPDIVEIDAASNNRVDEIRDLRDKVGYHPTMSKYKVYIIDEVHMLSDSAFNALLKTLEEPPSYAVFILATTEPNKLPATILSRCMRFDFRLVPVPELAAHVKRVLVDSGKRVTDDAAALIARLGEGSVRDALSLADTAAAAGEEITHAGVLEIAGLAGGGAIRKLCADILR